MDKTNEENSGTLTTGTGSTSSTVPSGSTQVSKAIQSLAQRYCGEFKSSFEELSKIIQRVLACRRELVAYDRNQKEKGFKNTSGNSANKNVTNTSGLVTSSAAVG